MYPCSGRRTRQWYGVSNCAFVPQHSDTELGDAYPGDVGASLRSDVDQGVHDTIEVIKAGVGIFANVLSLEKAGDDARRNVHNGTLGSDLVTIVDDNVGRTVVVATRAIRPPSSATTMMATTPKMMVKVLLFSRGGA